MDTGLREQEGVGTMGVAEAMAGVILVTGMSLKIEVAVGEDLQTAEVMDIRGMRMVAV